MQQIKWFERKFAFDDQNIFPAVIERLWGTPVRLQAKWQAAPSELLRYSPDGQWTIKENIGHLIDLEPLWQGRLEDIMDGKTYLREADLSNQRTDEAGHNDRSLEELLGRFSELRSATVRQLQALQEEDVFRSALHPRLEQPMRTMDLFLFVAEHDDHHLATMEALRQRYLES